MFSVTRVLWSYGKVTYLVHQGEVSFFESKARITPFKSQQKEEDKELSIPASELMAAYLGVVIATIIIAAPEPRNQASSLSLERQ